MSDRKDTPKAPEPRKPGDDIDRSILDDLAADRIVRDLGKPERR